MASSHAQRCDEVLCHSLEMAFVVPSPTSCQPSQLLTRVMAAVDGLPQKSSDLELYALQAVTAFPLVGGRLRTG